MSESDATEAENGNLLHLVDITTKVQDILKQLSLCEHYKKQLLEKDEEIKQLESQNQSKIEAVSKYEEDLRSKSQEIDAVKQQLDEKDTKIDQLENRLQSEVEAVSELTETVKKYEEDLHSKSLENEEKNAQIKQLDCQLKEMKAELESARRLADALRKRQQNEMSPEVVAMMKTLLREFADFVRDTSSIVKYVQERAREFSSKNSTAETADESNDQPCLPEQFKRLQRNRETVVEKLEAKKVAAWMFQNTALTVAELQSVLYEKNPCKAAEKLINLILKEPNEDIYSCFLNGILQANQPHVFSLLMFPDYIIDCQHAETIQKNYVQLLNCLDAKNGLLSELYSGEVLDELDYQDLRTEQDTSRLNEKLLLMLGRKSAKDYEVFLDTLDKTGQSPVKEILQGKDRRPELINEKNKFFQQGHEIELASVDPRIPLDLSTDRGLLRQVRGVTQVDSRIFILCQVDYVLVRVVAFNYGAVIDVFCDRSPFKRLNQIQISQLEDPRDIVASFETFQLFVGDWKGDIWRVDLKSGDSEKFVQNKNGVESMSLRSHRLLVTSSSFFNSLYVFDVNNGGELLHTKLSKPAYHAIESNHETFFVGHSSGYFVGYYKVSEINFVGQVIRASGRELKLGRPLHLAFDSSGNLLVADSENGRIVRLTEKLTAERIVCQNGRRMFRLNYSQPTDNILVCFTTFKAEVGIFNIVRNTNLVKIYKGSDLVGEIRFY